VLGTKSITGVDQITAAFEMSENIYLSIDWDKTVMSHSAELKHMSPRSLADIARNIGIEKLLFTDLSRTAATGSRQQAAGDGHQAEGDGQRAAGSGQPGNNGLQANKPMQLEIIKELSTGPLPLYVGGGIREADLEQLKLLGASGALLSVMSIITEAG
jgi:phosphoribosylformimino-5-aminoimidazole carboxamide ribonucleotide (ProFAR) isomerase